MGAPRGYEDMGEDVSNSGFVFINLKKWREENTLTALLEFGRKLPKSQFCDQYLLHEYFKKNNSNRLLLVDKNYNVFPHLMTNISIEDMKILHFTGYNNIKPWDDIYLEQRGSFLFWKYARLTNFYEFFIFNIINKHINVLTNEIKEYKYEFNEYKNANKLLIKIKNKIYSLIHNK